MNEVIYTTEDMDKIISFLINQPQDITISSLLSQILDFDEIERRLSSK